MRASAGQIVFGPFCLDTEGPRLLRNGVELELRPQAFQALRALVQASGRCVDYEEMIGEAWHGISVSRHTVAVTVGEVKRALKEHGAWISYHPKLGYRLDVPRTEDHIRNGWHYWQRHTREGFEKALCCFQQAAQLSCKDFRAFEGISRTYLMLATFAMKPPREMYAAFLEAHKRAVESGGLTPELRADRAQGLHIFEFKFEEAEAELLTAQRENPRVAGVYIRLAILYGSMKRFDEAMTAVARAYEVDGLWPILPSVEILLRYCGGELEHALACGKKALDLHPYFAFGHSHYGQALELAGRFEDALAQYRLASVMFPESPRFRAEEAECLARLGRLNEALSIAEELQELRRTEYVDGYVMAFLYSALGRKEEALDELERAGAESSPYLFMMDMDPRMDIFRDDPRFIRLRNSRFRSRQRPKAPDTGAALRRGSGVIPRYRSKVSTLPDRVAP